MTTVIKDWEKDWEAVHKATVHEIVFMHDDNLPAIILKVTCVHPSTNLPKKPPVNQGEIFLELESGILDREPIAARTITYQVRADTYTEKGAIDLWVDHRKVVRRKVTQ